MELELIIPINLVNDAADSHDVESFNALRPRFILQAQSISDVSTLTPEQQDTIGIRQEHLLIHAHSTILAKHLYPDRYSHSSEGDIIILDWFAGKADDLNIDFANWYIRSNGKKTWINLDVRIGSQWYYFYCPDIDTNSWYNYSEAVSRVWTELKSCQGED